MKTNSVARLDPAALTGLVILDDECLERPVADQFAHLRVRKHLDLRAALDPVGQVARHVSAQVFVAQIRVHLRACWARNSAACPAELPPPTTATGSPRHRCASIWSRRSRRSFPRTPPTGARRVCGSGRPSRSGPSLRARLAIVEPHDVVAVTLVEGRRLRRHADARAELLGLDLGPVSELRARDAGREAEIVLDPRGGPGLSTRRDCVERDRPQALRGTVDGCGEPGGPGPTTRRSQTSPATLGARRPIICASSSLLGLRSTWFPRQITTGVSSGATPSPCSRASAASSSSRSIHRCGSRLRAANSRRLRESGEIARAHDLKPAPSPISISRRSR